jgi:hypothetical protein
MGVATTGQVSSSHRVTLQSRGGMNIDIVHVRLWLKLIAALLTIAATLMEFRR